MNGREGRRRSDFYAILGLDKGCTPTELRNAYKSLAMRWHPDRCSASGNAKFVEEAKKKFQAIQQAYSVLSDEHKRFLYDVGVYDSDDEENNDGMGDFLDEMAAMMSQTKPSENGEESLEQLQELLDELIQGDLGTFSSCSSSHVTFGECSSASTRRSCSDMNSGEPGTGSSTFDPRCQSFCFGVRMHSSQILGGFLEFPSKEYVLVMILANLRAVVILDKLRKR
ncbi:hypothetical protein Ancab_029300 [Ancistrocladus abbreviatus]